MNEQLVKFLKNRLIGFDENIIANNMPQVVSFFIELKKNNVDIKFSEDDFCPRVETQLMTIKQVVNMSESEKSLDLYLSLEAKQELLNIMKNKN